MTSDPSLDVGRPGRVRAVPRRGAPPGREDPPHPVGELRLARPSWKPSARSSPTSTARGTRASATTRGSSSSTRWRSWPSTAPRRCSAPQHANVQPYSGSPANLAVYLAFLKPGDKVMGLALPMGGHLTHGWNVSITGKYFTSVQYGVRKDTGRIDYDEVRDLAKKEKPRAAVGGRHRLLAPLGLRGDGVDRARGGRAVLRGHRAHRRADRRRRAPVAGPARRRGHDHDAQDAARAARRHDPVPRRARPAAIDRAVFPGLQGGPHVHNTAALAVALREAAQPAFKEYAKQRGRERPGHRRGADGARLRRRLGRHRQPPDPGRPDEQERARARSRPRRWTRPASS